MNPREVNIGASGMPYSDAQRPGPRRPRDWGFFLKRAFFFNIPDTKMQRHLHVPNIMMPNQRC